MNRKRSAPVGTLIPRKKVDIMHMVFTLNSRGLDSVDKTIKFEELLNNGWKIINSTAEMVSTSSSQMIGDIIYILQREFPYGTGQDEKNS